MLLSSYPTRQKALSNILKAYAHYNPEVGYCQGMSGITALLLMYMEEEVQMLCLCNDSRCKDSHDLKEAWWTLVALQSANQYNMAGLYKPGFPRLFSCFSLHESLLKMTMPNLHSHFVRSLQQHSNVLTLYLARPKKQLSPPCMQRNGFLMCS